MSKIIGITAGTPVPQSDWEQKDPNKADYIKNKPDLSKIEAPIATNETVGVVKGMPNGEYGVMISPTGEIQLRRATSDDILYRTHQNRPIVPANLKYAVTSVFEDVYGEVYVETGKLKSLVSSFIADVMNSMVRTFWDGDVWGYDDGTDVSVSVDSLHDVKGEFVGQIIIINEIGDGPRNAFMYLGTDHQKHYWTKLNAL